ncbi:hypothetical protein LTR70_010686 [Exophiala xenobiotica]|uniref:Uncharacterized protein n=1 Tax=Lithohypha guttulata TaxID=1690604 RepID=A0ABR0JT67_9EURO|nr:hypothetical protein LTR24_010667 [Lithohypha guttulata]KAK5308995.1 hypothetical protein LTR70_010686 [Exophiala xenobiotica]
MSPLLHAAPCRSRQANQSTAASCRPDNDIKDLSSNAGKIWSRALDAVTKSEGYQMLFWGRCVEQPEKVQLHVVRSSLSQHCLYLESEAYRALLDHVSSLVNPAVPPVVRHVNPMANYTSSPTTAFRAPVTGTAIYTRTTPAWHQGSWPCWTHIVRHVKGCTGIAGGKLLEPFDAKVSTRLAGASAPRKAHKSGSMPEQIEDCFLVYVGWETIKAHTDYHHTKHFRDHSIVLTIGNEGWREYGHVKFEGWRGDEATDADADASGKSKL